MRNPPNHQKTTPIITLVPCLRLIAVSLLGVSHVLLVAVLFGGCTNQPLLLFMASVRVQPLAPHDSPDELDKPTCLISGVLFGFFKILFMIQLIPAEDLIFIG